MSFRSKILSLVDVILRVPPLFIIDELFRISLGLSQSEESDSKESVFISQDGTNGTVTAETYDRDILRSKFLIITLIKVISSLVGK